MPIIPAQRGPSVQPSGSSGAFESINAEAGAFGGFTGRALQSVGTAVEQVGDVAAKHALLFQERQNQTLAKDAAISATDAIDDIQYNVKTGYMGKKKIDAVTGFQEAHDAVEQKRKEILAALPNDAVRRIAEGPITNQAKDAIRQMSRHAAQEHSAWEMDTSTARAASLIKSAGLNYTDDESFAKTLSAVHAEANDQARMQGMGGVDSDTAAIGRQKYTDQAWKTRIDAARMRDPVYALELLQSATGMSEDLRYKMGERGFADAAPVLASIVLRSPELSTVAASDEEAQGVAASATAFRQNVTVTVKGEAKTVFDRLPGDEKLKVLHLAKTMSEQGMAQVRQALGYKLADNVALSEQGMPTTPLTRDELVPAFGEVHADRILQQQDSARSYGERVQQVAPMPYSQQEKLLSEIPPAGQGSAEAIKRNDQIRDAVNQSRKAREKDASGYAISVSPPVRALFNDAAQAIASPTMKPEVRAQTAQAFAAASLAEQARLEIPDDKRSILPGPIAKQIVAQFYEPPPKDGSKPVQPMSNVIRGMSDMWGPHWGTVLSELTKEHLPSTALVIGEGTSPIVEKIVSDNAHIPLKDQKHGLDEPAYNAMKENIRKKFEDFGRTLLSGNQKGGTRLRDAYLDTAETVALSILGSEKTTPAKAADRAFDLMIADRYEVRDEFRIPKAMMGGDVTMPNIRTGMNTIIRDVAATAPLYVPPPSISGMRSEDSEKQWRETVKDNGFWVTTNSKTSDDAAMLYVRAKGISQMVLDTSGQPIVATWKHLADEGKQFAPFLMENRRFQETRTKRGRNVDAP